MSMTITDSNNESLQTVFLVFSSFHLVRIRRFLNNNISSYIYNSFYVLSLFNVIDCVSSQFYKQEWKM